MNDRIKEVRKKLKLTQREFGKRLGVQDTAISKIESGERNLTDQMVLAICREFNVNEEWLRTGAGGNEEMFIETDDTIISNLVSEYGLDKMSEIILRTYVEIDESQRKSVNNFIRVTAAAIMEENIAEARNGIVETIINSHTTEEVKKGLHTKALSVFNDAFPYVGVGNVDIDDFNTDGTIVPDDDEQAQLLKMVQEESRKEKRQESQASSVKKSDVG